MTDGTCSIVQQRDPANGSSYQYHLHPSAPTWPHTQSNQSVWSCNRWREHRLFGDIIELRQYTAQQMAASDQYVQLKYICKLPPGPSVYHQCKHFDCMTTNYSINCHFVKTPQRCLNAWTRRPCLMQLAFRQRKTFRRQFVSDGTTK